MAAMGVSKPISNQNWTQYDCFFADTCNYKKICILEINFTLYVTKNEAGLVGIILCFS